jgi:thiol peroxidase
VDEEILLNRKGCFMNHSHHSVSFHGQTLTLLGRQVKEGDTLPDFTLTGTDMTDFRVDKFNGKNLIICAVPSLDTPVCSLETKHFNQEAEKLGDGVAVLTVSMDLPFAQKRWCGAEGVSNVTTGSDYKYRTFGEAFGVLIQEWGLLSRAVFVSDKSGKVVYSEYVPEVSSEPNYEAALQAVPAL